jgi:hypothetical protein
MLAFLTVVAVVAFLAQSVAFIFMNRGNSDVDRQAKNAFVCSWLLFFVSEVLCFLLKKFN